MVELQHPVQGTGKVTSMSSSASMASGCAALRPGCVPGKVWSFLACGYTIVNVMKQPNRMVLHILLKS